MPHSLLVPNNEASVVCLKKKKNRDKKYDVPSHDKCKMHHVILDFK